MAKESNTPLEENVNPTKEQVAAWQEEHGKLLHFELADDEGETMHFYFKRSYKNKRQVLALATKKLVNEKDLHGYAKILINNALVNGHAVVEQDDDVFQALVPVTDKLATRYTANLVK